MDVGDLFADVFNSVEQPKGACSFGLHAAVLAAYNAHTESLFKKSEILPLNLLIEYFRVQFMHQYLNNKLPVIFNSVWPTNADRRMSYDGPQLRNEEDLYVQISRLASRERYPLICFPRAWNDFPSAEIKSIPDKLPFNKALKKHFLGELSADYLCSVYYVPLGFLFFASCLRHVDCLSCGWLEWRPFRPSSWLRPLSPYRPAVPSLFHGGYEGCIVLLLTVL